MLTTWARTFFRGFLETIGRFFVRVGVTPNQLTLAGLFLQAVVAAVIAAGWLQLGGVLLILFSIFDAFDGTVARLTGRVSRFGAFFDSTLDRYAEAFVLFGLLVYETGQSGTRTEVLLIYASIVGSLLVSYTRAKAESLGIKCMEGILTRAERVALLADRPLVEPLPILGLAKLDDARALAACHPKQFHCHAADLGCLEGHARRAPRWIEH